jgi:osmotically inducible lipoprotein OsmB
MSHRTAAICSQVGVREAPEFIFTKDRLMNTRFFTSFAIGLMVASLAACSGMSTRDKNTAAGAAIGGVAGAVLTGGSTAGTVGGAAVGGVIGNKIDPAKK